MKLLRNRINQEKWGSKTSVYKGLISFLMMLFMIISFVTASAQQKQMMVRIAEIEIDPIFLEEYKAILKEESAASVKLEPGVIAIFPMYEREKPTQIRLLEIYANKTSYEQHLKTPHFQKYKTTTLKMVKSLKLIDMEAMDLATMPLLFRKLKG
jgi:quinol monooxygenase YgiN